MTANDPKATGFPDVLKAHTGDEIARVLESLMAQGVIIAAYLNGGALLFQSKLRFLDPARQNMIIGAIADPAANAALLARPGANFLSQGGVGLLYDPNITLAPGTLLAGCRIERTGEEPVTVDLLVRYSLPVVLPDGRRALRAGCRFVNPSNAVMELIGLYVGGKS